MTVDLRTSPLHQHDLPHTRTVQVTEIPFTTAINLRVNPQTPAAQRIAARLTPLPPPNAVRTVLERSVLGLGPDEWLVTGPDGDAPVLGHLLKTALGNDSGSVVDVSANRTTIELRGSRAREVLEAGCTIDLHPRAFHSGRCAQTLLGKAQVIVWQTGPQPCYRLLVRGSFAGYVADWLREAITWL